MSDFHQNSGAHHHHQYLSDPMPMMTSAHSDVLPSELGSVQEHMNEDLHEIAAADILPADSTMAFSDELIEMAEAEEASSVKDEENTLDPDGQAEAAPEAVLTQPTAYLEPRVEAFIDAVSRLRQQRLQLLETERARRIALV